VLDPASGLTVDDGMRASTSRPPCRRDGRVIDNLSSADLRMGFDKIVAFGLRG
jgi:hypothetical protein